MIAAPVVTTAQIGAQLDAVLKRKPDAAAVAIRSAYASDWPQSLERPGRRFRVRWCASRLALREALTELEQASDVGLVLMTPLGDADVPDDVIARLARARVFQPTGWETVRQLFGARQADARLQRHDWMPEVLIEANGRGPYAPVIGDYLDLDTAWREVMGRCLGLDDARPDAVSLMRWAGNPEASLRLQALPPRAATDALLWMGSHAGPAGRLIARCIEAGRGADAAPIGLVCDVLFGPPNEGVPELAQAAVRLERHVGDEHLSVADARHWAEQARRLLEHESAEDARALLERAGALMRELRVGHHAVRSDWLPAGLEQRLQRYAMALDAHVAAPSPSLAAPVEEAADAVLAHRLAPRQALRLERVRMARRLARWLAATSPLPGTLERQAAAHAEDGAFVDWARFKLLGGDELPELSIAYGHLRAAVSARLEQRNGAFARTLATHLREARPYALPVVPVESVLQELVGPLATGHPVLLLVVDGLSLSIFRELFERPAQHGWVELQKESAGQPLVGLAAIPTITETSRASLLCGRIATGTAPAEKAAFASHDALRAGSASLPPKLFHKAELAVDGNLADSVREAVADPGRKVVGVVYNAVDDHLGGSDQLGQRWSLEELRLLLPLLREARDSRRLVVVTADHGHVLEDGSALLPGGISDRWRTAAEAADPREIALTGPRVRTPEGADRVVCLWSEAARYTGRKNGYHGGASPAEAIVPLSVYAPFGVNVAGWQPAPPQQPAWWDLPVHAATQAPPQPPAHTPKPPARRTVPPPDRQPGLFGTGELPVPAPKPDESQDWMAGILASPVYDMQRRLAARVALPDATMHALLAALDERGGKLTRGALAHRLGVAEMRVAGLLSAARRVLNVDQSRVLDVDEASGTVTLDRELLRRQFRIEPTGERS